MSNTILVNHPEYSPEKGQENLRNAFPHFWSGNDVKKYVLRVSIEGIEPDIYREYVVPSNTTMRHFAHFTIDVLGWIGFKLHWFEANNEWYTPYFRIESNKLTPPAGIKLLPQEDYTLSDVMNVPGKTICFVYDCDYLWKHKIELLSIEDYAKDEPLFAVLNGARECPPEICGGMEGYNRLVEIHKRMSSGQTVTPEEEEFFNDCYYVIDDEWGPESFEIMICDEICKEYNNH